MGVVNILTSSESSQVVDRVTDKPLLNDMVLGTLATNHFSSDRNVNNEVLLNVEKWR